MTRETFTSALRAAGLKATPGRLALLEILHGSKNPQGIEKVMQALGSKINRTTAYRSLAALEKAGLVRRVDLRHGHADYELVPGREHHHHLICTDCGRIEDLGCELKNLEGEALKQGPAFAQVDRHSLEFFGVCKICAGKAQKTPA